MRNFALSFILLISFAITANANAAHASASGTIQVRIDAGVSTSFIGIGVDSNDQERLHVITGSESYYQYVTENGEEKVAIEVSQAQGRRLKRALEKASPECPLDLKIDSASFKILKITEACK